VIKRLMAGSPRLHLPWSQPGPLNLRRPAKRGQYVVGDANQFSEANV